MDEPIESFESACNIGAAALSLEEENFADDAQCVTSAAKRWNEQLDVIGKEEQPDFVVVADGAEGENARRLRR